MASWFKRISDAVYREYDRRIKRASLIDEYGARHAAGPDVLDHHAEEDEGEVEIVNLPRGTAVAAPTDDEVEIANLPRGTVVQASQPTPIDPSKDGKHAPESGT